MPLTTRLDAGGCPLTVLDVGGKLLFPKEEIEDNYKEMSSFEARREDVIVCAYAKSGTHWLWEIVNMLMRQSAQRIEGNKGLNMLENISKNQFEAVESPRVFNTHLKFSELPESFRDKKCKIVYIYRNPKDIAVSFYHHHGGLKNYNYNGKWADYLPLFLKGEVDYGAYFEDVPDWEKTIKSRPGNPIHVMSFEDLLENGVEEITKLSIFLEVPTDPGLISEIHKECSFAKMKSEKEPMGYSDAWKEGVPSIYRKGKVGDWKNWFTVAQNEMFDAVFEDKMKDTSLKFRYEL